MIKLYGHPSSTCTRKVLCALHETNTPHELIVVDFAKGEHKQPPHLARQPFGQVPSIDHDGFALFESRAIIRYVNETSGGNLVPQNARGRALMEQWISVETSDFTPMAMKLVYNYVFYPMRGQAQDPQMISDGNAGLAKALTVLDARLAKAPYLAGEQFSLADVCYLPYVEYLIGTPAKELFATHANVNAWWSRSSERSAWRKAAGRA